MGLFSCSSTNHVLHASSMLFSSSPPPPLSVSTPSTQQSLPSPIPWLLMLPGGLRRLLLYPHTTVAVILLLQRLNYICLHIFISSQCIKQAPLSLSMRITTLMFETTLRLSSTKLFPREDLPLEAYPRRSVVLYFTLNFKRNESSLSFWFLSSHSRDCKK